MFHDRYNKLDMKINRKDIWILFDKRCAYCGIELPDESGKYMHIDHVEPMRRNWFLKDGSSLNPENDNKENLFPSCPRCNNYKGSLDIESFRSWVANTPHVLEGITAFRNALRFGMIEVKQWDKLFYFERKPVEETFTCEWCHKELPMSERGEYSLKNPNNQILCKDCEPF